MWRVSLSLFRTTQILLERRKGKIAQPDQQATCHHVKEDAYDLGGGDTFAICLAAVEVSLLSTAAACHLCPWMSQQKVLHGFAEHHQSTILFLINLMYFYDAWVKDVYVFWRGVPDTQGGRGGVEGKGHFSGNEQSSYTPHYKVSEVTRNLQC